MKLAVRKEIWPIRGTFTISRGSKTEAEVIVVSVTDGAYEGRGECVPYKRYGETIESVEEQIMSVQGRAQELTRQRLQELLPAGAARNAIDCALWDLEAKQVGKTIWDLLSIARPIPKPTMFTLSLDTPEKMAEAAAIASARYSLLKIKLGGEGDEERLRKIREVAPKVRLIIDANEGWNEGNLEKMLRMCESVGVELIEQPLPVGQDDVLIGLETSITVCADESAHVSKDIGRLAQKYDAVNIKLDKSGGLTEALIMAEAARGAGLSIMVGCMVSTSLSMAPATVIAQFAEYADLDGPLLLAKDREPAIGYSEGNILPTTSELWG
ncbi:MAG: N-acetyl-D-Glu racemase DgcA [Minisyncoccia bacterium]